MPTIQDIASDALASLNSNAGILNGLTWTNNRYKQLANKVRLRAQRRVGTIEIPAQITAGTITTTRGLQVVTGNAAAQTAWTQDIVGRYIRGNTTWYEITNAYNDELRIEPAWGETALAAGSYEIISRYFTLPKLVRWLGMFVHMRQRKRFRLATPEELDHRVPVRIVIGEGPTTGAESGTGLDGAKRIELYPFSKAFEVIHYEYWEVPDKLRPEESLPTFLDQYVLKEGVYVDIMRWEMQAALHAGQMEIGAVWRNDYRAQETKWERAMSEGVGADRGDGESTVVLSRPHLVNQADRDDVKTAEDHVWLFGEALD